MGTEYKRNYKNFVGRPDLIGHDVLELGATLTQAPVGATALTDRQGTASYLAGSDARLEGVMVQASGAIGLGRVGVEVLLDGAVVATGNLYAGGPQSKYFALKKGLLQDVPVASGQALTANYSVEQSLDTGQALRASLNLALLEFPER